MTFHIPHSELIDLKYEISMLEKQLDFIREQINHQTSASKLVTDQKIEAANLDSGDPRDEADYWYHVDEHNHLVDDVLPRILINPFAVSIWSLYESAMRDLADLIKEKENVALSFSDIRGKHLPDRVQKYFTHVLDFPVRHNSNLRGDLSQLKAFRNAIAHQNGRLSGLKKRLKKSIREDEVAGVDIARLGDYFVIRVGFAEQAFAMIKNHLNGLFNEYEDRY